MELLRPDSWSEALEMRAGRPEAVPIAGGTDLMVDLNFDRRRPEAVLDLTRVGELTGWEPDGDVLRLGAGLTFTRLIGELGDRLPGLATASRTVGSPQIRNRGTVGGNLGTASPAGDVLPGLFAGDAEVEVASVHGTRRLPVAEFIAGPKQTALAPGELIAAVRVRPADGAEEFAKVGTRNAMVISVCSLAVSVSRARRHAAACLGSAGPTPLRATAAEAFLTDALEEAGRWETPGPLPDGVQERFAALVADAARPIDDVRGSAPYRTHAIRVLAGRLLGWAWEAECA